MVSHLESELWDGRSWDRLWEHEMVSWSSHQPSHTLPSHLIYHHHLEIRKQHQLNLKLDLWDGKLWDRYQPSHLSSHLLPIMKRTMRDLKKEMRDMRYEMVNDEMVTCLEGRWESINLKNIRYDDLINHLMIYHLIIYHLPSHHLPSLISYMRRSRYVIDGRTPITLIRYRREEIMRQR